MAMPDTVSTTVNTAVESSKKWWDSINLRKWAESIGGNSAEAIEAAIYFGLFFAIGFLCKKYFKVLLVCIVFSVFAMLALEYLKFVVIDWPAIKTACGISTGIDINAMTTRCFDWIKAHMLLFIASTVGFLIGYKLG